MISSRVFEGMVLSLYIIYFHQSKHAVNALASHADEKKLLTELTGNTLIVYWYLLRKKQNPVGVREVQRAMGFSSSSSAEYHLQKLTDLGLIHKDQFGNYKLKEDIRVGLMKPFLFVGGTVFPRHLIYSIVTSLTILGFVILFYQAMSLILLAALSPGILAAAIFWYETAVVWRSIPSKLIGSKDSQKRSKV